MIVIDKLYCKGLVGIIGIGGLESDLEVAMFGRGFVCITLMLIVFGIFVSVVFCAEVYECVVTDGRSRFEDLIVNCGRVLVIRASIMLLEDFDC